jgi:hypothetical protein
MQNLYHQLRFSLPSQSASVALSALNNWTFPNTTPPRRLVVNFATPNLKEKDDWPKPGGSLKRYGKGGNEALPTELGVRKRKEWEKFGKGE